MDDRIELDDNARAIGVEAVRAGRLDGCDCVPDVELSPTATAPWWSPVLRHDETCALVVRLRAENAARDAQRRN